MLIVKIKTNAGVPKYQSTSASGSDLMANIDNPVILQPMRTIIIPTGISLAIPAGYEGQIRSRSGLAAKNQVVVLNSPGTIDADYRGEIKVILINLSTQPFTIEPSMRIAQLVFAPVIQAKFDPVDNLDQTVRADKGFGSTGV